MSSVRRVAKAFAHLARVPEILACVAGSSDWASLTAGYVGLRALPFPHAFRTRGGRSMTLEQFHDLVTAWIVFFRREYRVLAGDRVIVDVGANIGSFSLYASARAPRSRVVALEPFPQTMTRLRRHVEQNGLAHRIACRPWALAAESGVRRMDVSDAALPSQSRAILARDAGAVAHAVEVEALTLGELMRREGLAHVDFLKMDIEGAEHEVLMGTPAEVLRRVGRIGLEYHPNGSRAALFRHLERAGFGLTHDARVGRDSGVAHFVNRRAPMSS
jgi:FkbM family methyltransferase